jgi:hypothetical protein
MTFGSQIKLERVFQYVSTGVFAGLLYFHDVATADETKQKGGYSTVVPMLLLCMRLESCGDSFGRCFFVVITSFCCQSHGVIAV